MKISVISIFIIFRFSVLIAQESDAELLYQETSIIINKGKLIKTVVYEIKINNRAGERYTKIVIPYSKMVKVSKIEAYIKEENGDVVKKLKKSDIRDRSAISDISFYEDNFIKEFTLKHNKYPYSIYYSFQTLQNEFFHITSWIPVIDLKTPTHKAILNIQVPISMNIYFKDRFVDNFKKDTIDNILYYSWEVSYNKFIESEDFSPDLASFLPKVEIVPEEFKYEIKGSLKSWLFFGNWLEELKEGLSELPQQEKMKITSLISQIKDDKEKIKVLYHYLQDQTRYINISIETGGLKPYPASYVALNKYGDCKALTNYFKSILDFVEIESFYTIVNAGDNVKEIDKEFPSQQFNHVILCTPNKEDTVWLDCTSKGPFNYLGTFTQNRDVFLIDKNNSHFAKTPKLEPKDVLESRRVEFYQNLQGEVDINYKCTYKGGGFEYLKSLLNQVSENRKKQIIRNYFIEEGYEVADFNLLESHRDSNEISLSYKAKSNNTYKKYGEEIIIDIMDFSIPHFETFEKRKLPIQLDYPVYKSDTLEYQLPERYFVSNNLTNEDIVNEFGRYKIEFVKNENNIQIVKSFLLKAGYYSIEKYKDFYAFISKIKELEKNTYIVTSKQK